MFRLPTLYKLDSKGKVREWSIEYGKTNKGSVYIQTHGLLDGKKQEDTNVVLVGKNIGKANETTPAEQCASEAKSLWQKKKDRKGYSEDIPTDKPLMPMLAADYTKHGKKIDWPACTQPKLDGIRCMAIIEGGKITLKSRTNKEFTALQHIKGALRDTIKQLGKGQHILDGELYNHEYKEDFQSLVSMIRKDDPTLDTSKVQYHVYDIFTTDDFIKRNATLKKSLVCNGTIKLVETYEVATFAAFTKKYGEFITHKYEGGMLRNKTGPYEQNRRSPNLQKFKEFITEEFKIVGAKQNKGRQNKQCTFTCVTDEGDTFDVKPKGDETRREKYWTDFQAGKLMGKLLTVKFFEWTTSDASVPRFPVGLVIRDYE